MSHGRFRDELHVSEVRAHVEEARAHVEVLVRAHVEEVRAHAEEVRGAHVVELRAHVEEVRAHVEAPTLRSRTLEPWTLSRRVARSEGGGHGRVCGELHAVEIRSRGEVPVRGRPQARATGPRGERSIGRTSFDGSSGAQSKLTSPRRCMPPKFIPAAR